MITPVQSESARLLDAEPVAAVRGSTGLQAAWDVDALATGSVAAFADAVVALLREAGIGTSAAVDGPLVGAWFQQALRPVGWSLPSPWDAVAGDYAAADGWIRLHTNAPRHRAAAIGVLGTAADRTAVADRVATWRADDLETAVVEAGGAAAAMRSPEAWMIHPQGAAARREPLVDRLHSVPASTVWHPQAARPLAGVRVLDLTRVLAGPVATRALAALGATVLRVDPPDWDEPAVVPEMTLGKQTVRLDARTPAGRERLQDLLAGADVLVHGYRRGALDPIGLGDADRQDVRPGLVEVALTAYGWSGPWTGRRGFDSLVQMSSGIAERGMRLAGADRPVPLPVQALDHATGWLMAAAAVAGLRDRLRGGSGSRATLSLARTAAELLPAQPGTASPPAGLRGSRIPTPWGEADLLPLPVAVDGVDLRFDLGPSPLGSGEPAWPA
ncbi:CoA transferase [uncultured Amnibacterium sp.]|uniref:CoA transferase n=1 Tax=uncultured Amnibacterium sp. TaxID=1631851 RepID=UPI0035CB8857